MSGKKRVSVKKSKRASMKKEKSQADEERKQREAERAKRDAERAKKRLALKAKILNQKKSKRRQSIDKDPQKTIEVTEREQRKKVLRFRRAQSRFALPKINPDDDLDAIAKANAELQSAINDNNNTNNNDTDKPPQTTNITVSKEADTKTSADTEANGVYGDEKKEDNENNLNVDTDDTQSVSSYGSVEELTLSNEQEQALTKLMNDLESADPDYYGFVDYQKFTSILKKNEIKMTAKQETFLMGALTLIDEGVDYYDFSRKVREEGRELQPDSTLQDICEEIAESVEREQAKKKKQEDTVPTTVLEKMSSVDIADVDEQEFEKFFQKATSTRGRGMSLARMNNTAADVDKQTELGALIDDLALDGADVDFALLKMALSTIDCNPSDKDLKYLINHLCQDDSGFVDFNYLLTFLQETSGLPVKKWRKIEKIISKVVNQLKMVERAEARKKQQSLKIKQRFEKKRVSRLAQLNKGNDELAQLQAEEKRLRALALREKAKQLK